MDKIKVTFAPGCFDNFEGSQEELDQLVAQIKDMFGNLSPEDIAEQSQAIDIESMFEGEDPELIQQLMEQMAQNRTRVLN